MKLIAFLVLMEWAFSAYAMSTEDGAGDGFFLSRERRQGAAKVTIRGDNGLYLSLMRRGRRNTAKFTVDADATFDIVDHGNQFFSFIASNGKYLCRIFRRGADVIEASKDRIDPRCLFTLAGATGRLVTIKADNDRFRSRNDSKENDPIEANKNTPDVLSQFQIENV